MTLKVEITEDVTTVEVADGTTSVNVSPTVTTVEAQNIAITQASTANVISYTPSGSLEATNVQTALDELAAAPEFTTALKTKLDGIETSADVTDTANVVSSLTAGSNIAIANDGTVNADVVGALTAGTNISISASGEISASSISLTDVYTATSQTEHLNLSPTPNQGDVVIRTDENKTYIHNGGTAGTMADYTELASSNGVQSINGAAGIVTFGKTNLDGYVANEFIDWTVAQTQNIHANNYTNTTYTAGAGINIDSNNVISSTGSGTGGTSFTATGNLNLDSQNQLDTITTPIFDEVRFRGTDGVPTGILVKSFPNEDFGSGASDFFGEGFGIYYDNPNNNDYNLLAAITEKAFVIAGEFNTNTALEVGGVELAVNAQLLDTAARAVRNIPADIGNNKMWIPNSARAADIDSNSDQYNIANKGYVDTSINGLQVPQLPRSTGSDATDIRYLVTSNNEFQMVDLQVLPAAVTNQVSSNPQLVNFDVATGTFDAGLQLVAGTGMNISVDNAYQVTFSANPDGLPAQSATTTGKVLTSGSDQNAYWGDLSALSLPTQTGYSGKFLTTNGTAASWADVDAYPAQLNNDGKFLTTNGSQVSWADVDALPTQSNTTSGKFLASNGNSAYWNDPLGTIPSQTNNSGKYLTTNGTTATWADINTAGTTGNLVFSGNAIYAADYDQVKISDDLLVFGEVQAESVNVTGAGSPTLDSISTFQINAPDGVLLNGKRADIDSPVRVIYFDYNNNFDAISNIRYTGSNFEGLNVTPNVTFGTNGVRVSNLGSKQPQDFFAEVTVNHNTPDQTSPVDVVVFRDNGAINIDLVRSNDTPNRAATVKVKLYEI